MFKRTCCLAKILFAIDGHDKAIMRRGYSLPLEAMSLAEVPVLAEERRDLTGETARDRGTGEEGMPGGEPSSLP